VEGNADVDDGDLTAGLANHSPSGIIFKTEATYQPLQLVLDEQRMESTYRERGYFSAKVLNSKVTEVGTEAVDIAFVVREGPPTTLERVEVQGAPDKPGVDANALALVAALEVDRPLTYDSYLKAGESIHEALLRHGYAHARLDKRLEVDRDRGRGTAIFLIDAGPPAVFGTVRVDGLVRTPESVVLERVAWKEGEPFDPSKLERTRLQVYSTGLLGSVRFTWDTDRRDPVINVVIHATEGSPNELRLGAGAGLDRTHYELRARLNYTRRSFLDDRTTLRASARPALAFLPSGSFVGINVDAELSLERVDLFSPFWTGMAAVDYSLTEVDAFSYTGPGVRLSYGRRWWNDRVVVDVAAESRYLAFLRIEPGAQAIAAAIGLQDPLATVSLTPSIAYDGRDDRESPRKGGYARLGFEVGGVLTGAPQAFIKVIPELRFYTPIIWDRLVGAARLRVGATAAGLGPLPVTERFTSGGAEGQRGFGRGRLSPQVIGSTGKLVPVGGEALIESSLELRIGLFDIFDNQLRLALFLDGADVVLAFSELQLPNLHYAAGLGLRYDTPVGPVRVDFGVRLNRLGPTEPDPGERFAFHVSLGEAF